jgi:hypothetical protein
MARYRLTLTSTALAALVVPLVAATLWIGWIAAGEAAGVRPFSAPPLRNSAEAAAAGDAAAMLRFLRMGDNPTRIYPIDPSLISSTVQYATTLEAALWSRRVDPIRLLDRQGAIVGVDARRELACLAADLDLPDVVAYLAPHHLCVPGAALSRIQARTKEVSGADE